MYCPYEKTSGTWTTCRRKVTPLPPRRSLWGAIVTDALTATDPVTGTEAPTAMRTSAIILIACLAAPPIRQWMVFEQRISIALPLAGVALLGWHEMGPGSRTADVIYVAFMLTSTAFAFWGGEVYQPDTLTGGTTKSKSKEAPAYTRRESLNNLSIATLFYSSFRLMRAGIRHPDNVRMYRVSTGMYDGTHLLSVGYAYASSVTAASLCFGAAAGIGVASVLLINKDLREQGTSAATLVLTTAAFAQIAAAFIATLAGSEQLVNLGAIFSAGACGDRDVCAEAWRARRFAIVNGATGGLWLNGFGTILLAYAPSMRVRNRREMNELARSFEITIYAGVATLTCLGASLSYLSFSGAQSITDYAVVGAVAACLFAAFLDSLLGATLFLVSVGADLIMIAYTYGSASVFGHLTHCSNAVMLICLALYVVLMFTIDLTWRWLPPRLIELADQVAGVMTVAGTSISVALYLGTAALQSSYTGLLAPDDQFRAGDNRYERWTAIIIAEHYLAVMVWLPLYSCRCEVEQLTPRTRAIIWYSAMGIAALIWLLVRTIAADELTHVSITMFDTHFVVGLVAVAALPWLVIVWT